MESSELDLSKEELLTIVKKIVDTKPKTEDEPFSSPETFWKQGFHKHAFRWLHTEIKFAMQRRKAQPFENPVDDFQRKLNDEINTIGEALVSNPEQLEAFAKSGQWCDHRHLRKAVLTLLCKHSFPYLTTPTNVNRNGKLTYPKWLEGEWIQKIM